MLGVVGSAAGGLEDLRSGLVAPAIERGWRVAVTLTPTAGAWLRRIGEVERLEKLTGLLVRDQPRFPGEPRPHPQVDCFAVAPASANTVAKLADGLADNQALTQVSEALGTLDLPVVVFPRVNAAHTRHPARRRHMEALREADVRLIYGLDIWPLYEPRDAPSDRALP
ncbi:flavoprotein [Actinacidiphila bryophytorum]|uniref:flavoprotein n=1 Tax=Actinacidiphila bryophytorum TaxID=1436133 RepID=UPI0021769C82|nr:flavoprotein [Actinacidiphila bryophytorum]UWE12148.1 flavoprotein [Actinacidiphila bryophytorum]